MIASILTLAVLAVGIAMSSHIMSSIVVAETLLIAAPLLSFLYALSIQGFLAMWHECPWTQLARPMFTHLLWASFSLIITLSSHYFTAGVAQAALLWSLAVLFILISFITLPLLRKKYVLGPDPTHDNNKNTLQGKIILITGANTGIGKETARLLVRHFGATVIMACRSEARAREAREDILSSCPVTINAQDRMHILVMDVSSLESVRQAVRTLETSLLPTISSQSQQSTSYDSTTNTTSNPPHIDVLINNAGVMLGKYQTSVDGYELTMASNHLGHFLLTQLLIPFLRKSKDPRIIQVTSSTYVLAKQGMDLEDLFCSQGQRKYSLFGQYAQSKLANILFSLEFHRRELQLHPHTQPHIAIFNVHPGLVRTDVVRNMPWYLKYPNTIFGFFLALLQKTPEAGAYTSTYCATCPGLQEKSGCYFVNSIVMDTNAYAKDTQTAQKLWLLSEEWVQLKK